METYFISHRIDRHCEGGFAFVREARADGIGNLAFKYLRLPEQEGKGEWHRNFVIEGRFLFMFRDNPLVVRLHDFGFVPAEVVNKPYPGQVQVHSLYHGQEEDSEIWSNYAARYPYPKYIPYLVVDKLPRDHCLFFITQQRQVGMRLPTLEVLDFGLRLVKFMQSLHQDNIYYRDWKPAHLYWDGQNPIIIDWNVVRQCPKPERTYLQEDIRNFVGGILFAGFTGRDPKSGDIMPKPYQGEKEIDNRYKFSSKPTLSGMDYGLEDDLVDLLTRGVLLPEDGGYTDADTLLADLQICAARRGISEQDLGASLEQARDYQYQAFTELRSVNQSLVRAKQWLNQAEILTPDIAMDVRRLIAAIDTMSDHRVL